MTPDKQEVRYGHFYGTPPKPCAAETVSAIGQQRVVSDRGECHIKKIVFNDANMKNFVELLPAKVKVKRDVFF